MNRSTREALMYVLEKIEADERKLENDQAEGRATLDRATAQLDALRARKREIHADLEQL